jgi:hypothetical protein
MVVVMPMAAQAQSTPKADIALKQIDDDDCNAAVDTINDGMRAQEPRAFYIAGQLFQNGFCLAQNVPRSIRLYERGAQLGDRESARILALTYARGDGVTQSYREAGRWYAVMRGEAQPTAEPAAEAFAAQDVLVTTYIEAVKDLAFMSIVYPKDAVEKGVTGTVKVRFDPRFARVTLLSSTDNTGVNGGLEPNRHDFERALLKAYADAIRILAKPSMSPNVDNSVEQVVIFNRKTVRAADQPIGLYALPRS